MTTKLRRHLRPDVDRVIGADGETFGQFSERIMKEHYGDVGM